MVNEMYDFKPLGQIDMSITFFNGLLGYRFDICFAKVHIMLEIRSIHGTSIS